MIFFEMIDRSECGDFTGSYFQGIRQPFDKGSTVQCPRTRFQPRKV